MKIEILDRSALVYVVRNFLSERECEDVIVGAEATGFTVAPITTAAGPVVVTDVRNNTRVMRDDADLAQRLWERTEGVVPEGIENWEAVGLNERFRFYRYDRNERFAPHYDGAFARHQDERSHLTLMIYLNQGFEGGDTRFYTDDRHLRLSVTPETGMALFFLHCQLHEGAPVLQGRKYVMRTDVMYQRLRYRCAVDNERIGAPGCAVG